MVEYEDIFKCKLKHDSKEKTKWQLTQIEDESILK